jgi:hypothetical protein
MGALALSSIARVRAIHTPRLAAIEVVLDLCDPRTVYPRRSAAAAGGPAPEGGTASSASAKVPSGRLVPRRPRTPTKRHQTLRDLPGIVDALVRTYLAMRVAAA